jgi:hypothetical protein
MVLCSSCDGVPLKFNTKICWASCLAVRIVRAYCRPLSESDCSTVPLNMQTLKLNRHRLVKKRKKTTPLIKSPRILDLNFETIHRLVLSG